MARKTDIDPKDLKLVGKQGAFLSILIMSVCSVDFDTAVDRSMHHLIEALTENNYCDGVEVKYVNCVGTTLVVDGIEWDFSSPLLKPIKDDIYFSIEEAFEDIEKKVKLEDIHQRLFENAEHFLSEFTGLVNEQGAREMLAGMVIRLIDIYEIPHYPSVISLLKRFLLNETQELHKKRSA